MRDLEADLGNFHFVFGQLYSVMQRPGVKQRLTEKFERHGSDHVRNFYTATNRLVTQYYDGKHDDRENKVDGEKPKPV